jgi:hypothetical protein
MIHEHGGAATGRTLSVVLACDGAVDRMSERLDALARACEGLSADVFAVHGAATTVTIPADLPMPTTLLTAPSSLVPVLWGHGIAAARGRVVALTTTQFRVREGWARALLAGFDSKGVAGVGGRIALTANAGLLDRAVFLTRYSEHMSSDATDTPCDIAGDNAAYLRETVLEVCPDVAAGFWEVDVHRLMRAAGGRIGHAPGAVAEFAPALSLRETLINRFVHGSHFGAYRVRALRWPRWRAVAVTPLVPVVLLARILRRMRRAEQPLSSAVILLPAIGPLLVAWAAGEARGALSRDRRANRE